MENNILTGIVAVPEDKLIIEVKSVEHILPVHLNLMN